VLVGGFLNQLAVVSGFRFPVLITVGLRYLLGSYDPGRIREVVLD
jgi:hypothetical protein